MEDYSGDLEGEFNEEDLVWEKEELEFMNENFRGEKVIETNPFTKNFQDAVKKVGNKTGEVAKGKKDDDKSSSVDGIEKRGIKVSEEYRGLMAKKVDQIPAWGANSLDGMFLSHKKVVEIEKAEFGLGNKGGREEERNPFNEGRKEEMGRKEGGSGASKEDLKREIQEIKQWISQWWNNSWGLQEDYSEKICNLLLNWKLSGNDLDHKNARLVGIIVGIFMSEQAARNHNSMGRTVRDLTENLKDLQAVVAEQNKAFKEMSKMAEISFQRTREEREEILKEVQNIAGKIEEKIDSIEIANTAREEKRPEIPIGNAREVFIPTTADSNLRMGAASEPVRERDWYMEQGKLKGNLERAAADFKELNEMVKASKFTPDTSDAYGRYNYTKYRNVEASWPIGDQEIYMIGIGATADNLRNHAEPKTEGLWLLVDNCLYIGYALALNGDEEAHTRNLSPFTRECLIRESARANIFRLQEVVEHVQRETASILDKLESIKTDPAKFKREIREKIEDEFGSDWNIIKKLGTRSLEMGSEIGLTGLYYPSEIDIGVLALFIAFQLDGVSFDDERYYEGAFEMMKRFRRMSKDANMKI